MVGACEGKLEFDWNPRRLSVRSHVGEKGLITYFQFGKSMFKRVRQRRNSQCLVYRPGDTGRIRGLSESLYSAALILEFLRKALVTLLLRLTPGIKPVSAVREFVSDPLGTNPAPVKTIQTFAAITYGGMIAFVVKQLRPRFRWR